MKGTFFQKPAEYHLLVEGESWCQGDRIRGALTVRNHGGEALPLDDLRIALARAHASKVKQKSPQAFSLLGAVTPGASRSVAPGQAETFAWEFETAPDCPVTDGSASLYLLYGRGTASETQGQLQLRIVPVAWIQHFLDTIQTQFRFVQKSTRASAKGFVEVKLAPPSAKAFNFVEQLVLSLRFDGERLEAQYAFALKTVDATSGPMALKKVKKEYEQSFGPSDYRLASGRYHHERMEAAIREVLGQLAGGPLSLA
jgi:sporulation-control protein spo0M